MYHDSFIATITIFHLHPMSSSGHLSVCWKWEGSKGEGRGGKWGEREERKREISDIPWQILTCKLNGEISKNSKVVPAITAFPPLFDILFPFEVRKYLWNDNWMGHRLSFYYFSGVVFVLLNFHYFHPWNLYTIHLYPRDSFVIYVLNRKFLEEFSSKLSDVQYVFINQPQFKLFRRRM